MILNDISQDTDICESLETHQFHIKASSKAFQILSSNLYKNPLGAVIRELSTNCYDAHVMVSKKDLPFEIKIPNDFDPSLKFRDFGPGLSHEDIMSIYTTFFESTKTNSNDVVGCLGLGSKSPFAISDNFIVQSYFHGKKMVYSVYLDNRRIPSIAKIAEEETKDPNGLEIIIAQTKYSARDIMHEIKKQLFAFRVKPNVFGIANPDEFWNDIINYTEHDEGAVIILKGTNWKIIKRSYNWTGMHIVQGQVVYPIDASAIPDSYYENNDRKSTISRVIQGRVNMFFEVDIGDVSITPSREGLFYDDATIKKIFECVNQFLDEIDTQIRLAIDKSEHFAAATTDLTKIAKEVSNIYTSDYFQQTDFLFNGRKIYIDYFILPVATCDTTGVRRYEEPFGINYSRSYGGKSIRKENENYTRDYDHSGQTTKVTIAMKIPLSLSSTLFYDDLTPQGKKGAESRIKHYMDTNGYSDVLLLKDTMYTRLSQYEKLVDGLTIVNVSTLDKRPSETRPASLKATKETIIVRDYFNDKSSYACKPDFFSDAYVISKDFQNIDAKFYVQRDRYDLVYGSYTFNPKELCGPVVTTFWSNSGFKDDSILTLQSAEDCAKAEAAGLKNYLEILATHIKDTTIIESNEDISNAISCLRDLCGSDIKLYTEGLDPNHIVLKYVYAKRANNSYSGNYLDTLTKMAAIVLGDDIAPTALNAKEICEKYPMLTLLGRYHHGIDKVIEYIKTMDKIHNDGN